MEPRATAGRNGGPGTVNAGRFSTTPTPEMTGHTETKPMHVPATGSAHFGALVGRLLLAQIFLMAGVGKAMDFVGTQGQMTQAFQRAIDWYPCPSGLAQPTLAAIPWLAGIAVAVELSAGLGLVLGWFTRCSAAALFLFLIPATVIFHGFWMFEDAERQMQMINFMKNLAIMGGLSTLMSLGPGRISVDAKQCPACV